MDPRRPQRSLIDPKVRQVGFVPAATSSTPQRANSVPSDAVCSSSPPSADISLLPGNSLSPVMIPPARHSSAPVPVPGAAAAPSLSPVRRGDHHPPLVGSYNLAADSPLGSPPLMSPSSSRMDGSDFPDDLSASPASPWVGRGGSSNVTASSFPGNSSEMIANNVKTTANAPPKSSLTTASVVKTLPRVLEKGGDFKEMPNEGTAISKPLKQKTTKADRRAIQEAQRAAKAAAKEAASAPGKPGKGEKASSQKDVNYAAPVVPAPEKKPVDRASEKDRKKDVPHPRMQFDDKHRVEKAKRRAVVNQSEARNIVELFRHLPQYLHGTQLPDLEAKFFQLDPIHPSVYKVGLQYLVGEITGGNSRCIAMLLAFQEAIRDYSSSPEKFSAHDLTAKIGSYVSFLIECRPLSISMGNAIRFLKSRIRSLPENLPESEAKSSLLPDIDHFINEKIVLADKVIVRHAFTKIRNGDVLLTYGSPSVVEMILTYAHEQGKKFRVVVVDSRPKLEGQALLRRLVSKGLQCTYTHINGISYIMHEVTRVFLGAASILSNGTVYSRVGTAGVAMVANAFKVPVIVCCEAYKFHERVQLDSICSNELGDPDVISKVLGRKELNHLDNWANNENLQLLNLTYDATPSDYVSMVITDYGMLPPTSVPVIVREYRREKFWV